ncbi:hypothetical protein SEPCBS119000_002083 [Sporothrix epigloea]|uniref:F-box domain-containing protein n=1 Tax=Sporothrix epigloea TaxID=1892477 RepID=A0ABP0DEA0_9PEZI
MSGPGSGKRASKTTQQSVDSPYFPFHGARSTNLAVTNVAGPSTVRLADAGSCVVDDSDHDDEGDGHANLAAAGPSAASGKKAIKGIIRRASVSLHGFIQRRASFAGGSKGSLVTDDTPAAASFSLPNRLLRSSHAHSHSHSHSHSQTHPHSLAQGNLSVRLQSVTAEPRPNTSHALSGWHRVRQAASFRHSRVLDGGAPGANDSLESSASNGHFDVPAIHRVGDCGCRAYNHGLSGPTPSSSATLPENSFPITGPPCRSRPPVIPPHTGDAARAAAAAALQTDLVQLRPSKWRQQDDFGNDRESGIGIAVTSSELESADEANAQGAYGVIAPGEAPQLDITKVDFIGTLPMELAILILSELDASGLSSASRVSRAWHEAVKNQHIWRESFLREKTTTYATSGSVQPGDGLGVPSVRPSCDWRQIYRVKQELDRRWQEGKTRPVYLNGHSDSIYCLQFDEKIIITGSRDKTIRIWDMKTLACRLVIGPPEVIRDSKLLYDDDGQPTHYITTAYHTRSSNSMPSAVSFPMHHAASILCLQYDDRILVTGSSDSSCIIHSVGSGYRPIRRLLHHSAAVLDLCFDDRYIVTCSKDVTICVWDRESGTLLKQLRGHSGPVNAVQMRGNTIVSCSGDFRVKLWNIETGKAIREFMGHTKGLACSQFSEDGRFVVSAGNDRAIRIWDANTGECIREMKAHESLVRSLHVDSVSGRLVSASYDRDIKVFDMETGQQLLDFPQWHQSWVLSAKSDYRRIISTGQDPKILVMDFGAGIDGIEMLENAETDFDRSRMAA